MWMDAFSKVRCFETHLHCENSFGNQITCMNPHNTHTQYFFGRLIDDKFCHAFCTTQAESTTRSKPWKFYDFEIEPFFFGLILSHTTPSHFRICENYSWDCFGRKFGILAHNIINCHTRLMRSLVRQHGIAHDIAYGVE